MSEKLNKNTTIRFRVTEEESQQIDELCKRFKMSKSELIRCVMLGNLENSTFLLEMGTLPIIKSWHYVQEKLGYDEGSLDNLRNNINEDLIRGK